MGYKHKVYGIGDGRKRRIVAALSQKEAARILNMPVGHLRKYGSETGNIVECGVALNKIGTVFYQPSNDSLAPYKEEETRG